MERRRILVSVVFAALISFPAGAQAPAARPPVPAAISIPLPPEPICGPMVMEAVWSPDGRYILASRQQMLSVDPASDKEVSEHVVVLWHGPTRRVIELWRGPSESRVMDFQWVPGTPVAYCVMVEPSAEGELPTASLVRVDARRGTLQKLMPMDPRFRLRVSPGKSLAYLLGSDDEGAFIRKLESTGRLGSAIRLEGINLDDAWWSPDGATLYITHGVQRSVAASTLDQVWYAFDPASGQLTQLDKRPRTWEPVEQTSLPFLVTTKAAATLEKDTRPLAPLWFQMKAGEETMRELLSPDAEDIKVSPRRDGAMYQSRGSLYVVSLHTMNAQEMEAARARARLTMVMSNGKQIGLALMMYAMDYDEVLPSAGTDLAGQLTPYMKASGILDGFVYEFPGGKMSDIADPANTPFGHFNVPEGQVVVYADGHVQLKKPGENPAPAVSD